jgi:hypothetical protein
MHDIHSHIADLCQKIVLEKDSHLVAQLGMELYELLREAERQNFVANVAELEKTGAKRLRQPRAA